MADAGFTIFRGAASTTAGTRLFTAPTSTAIKVSNIAITNTAAGAATATIALAGVNLCSSLALAANSTTYLVPEQIVYDGENITGNASATTVNFHIAGSEVY
jgi:hypothetical protein